ncbi:MAG TPA: efflux RND transporter periplasmic adaptor subunit [Bryobacteraceae bacterium]|nr:efflux RND transporter periplasmic adaptor subunit [Bryobacteraceae bacterium]
MTENSEEALRAEIEALRRQLAERPAESHAHPHGHRSKRPSAGVLWSLALVGAAILVAAFFAGYLPQTSRETALAKESKDEGAALPPVNVVLAHRSPAKTELVLPGSIEAITEAPILARASGYIRKRIADIGDHVKEGQELAEIEAPELGHQVAQARTQVQQASSALEEANANLEQGKTNTEMARLTSERWNSLVARGAVARQDADTYRAQYEAQRAGMQALEKAVAAAKSNVSGAEANVARLLEMQSYLVVRAPFAGVITQRNVDTGALVNEGNTLLYRIAQNDTLRTFVNVPQADAVSIHVGQTADVTIASMPSKKFAGTVTRTANALDPGTRTLLAEVQVSNKEGLLLPGMYAQVNFTTLRAEPPIIIQGDALILRSNGPQVAVVGAGDVIHYAKVQVGRDYGDRVEILGGIDDDARLVVNPGDVVQEGVKVKPMMLAAANNNGNNKK